MCTFLSFCKHGGKHYIPAAEELHFASFPALICFALCCTDHFQVELWPVFIQQAILKSFFNKDQCIHCIL